MVALCERKVMQHFWSVSWMREGEDGIVGSSKSKVETIKLRVYCTLCRKMFTRVYRTASWLLPTEGRGPEVYIVVRFAADLRLVINTSLPASSSFKVNSVSISLHVLAASSPQSSTRHRPIEVLRGAVRALLPVSDYYVDMTS